MIEAHHLFGVPYERIDVVVHPQSIVHSLIHLNDGASLAHLGYPDMRVPISYALHYPERADVDVPRLDLAAVGELDLRGARPGDLRLPAPGAARPARRGGRRPASSTPPTRSRSPPSSTGGSRFTAIAEVIERVSGGDAGARRSPTSRTSSPPTPRRARRADELVEGLAPRMSWVLVFVGFCGADHPPRGGPLRRRQGDRDAGRALLPLLPAEAGLDQARRDRVRDRRDPARAAS